MKLASRLSPALLSCALAVAWRGAARVLAGNTGPRPGVITKVFDDGLA